MVFCLLTHLEQSSRSPVGTNSLRGRDGDVAIRTDSITFSTQLLVFLQRKINVTSRRLALNYFKSESKHLPIVGGKGFGH